MTLFVQAHHIPTYLVNNLNYEGVVGWQWGPISTAHNLHMSSVNLFSFVAQDKLENL